MINKIYISIFAVAMLIFTCAQCVWAADGWWQVGGLSNNWSDLTNWQGTPPVMADGDSATAVFFLDVPASGVVTANVDAAWVGTTIGNLYFMDMDSSTPGSYLITADPLTTLNLTNTNTGISQITLSPIRDGSGAELVAAEISAPISVTAGTSLQVLGTLAGTLKLSGNTIVNSGDFTADSACTVNLTGTMGLTSGNATVTGGSTLNVGGTMGLTSGNATVAGDSTLNVGGTMTVTGTGVTTLQSGTINVTGGLTTAGASINGGGTQALNISGAGTVTCTGQIYVGGTVNVGRSGFDDTAKLICNSTATDGSAALDFGRYGDATVIKA
jgi:hypothetical protein